MREIKFRAWHKELNKMFSAETMAEDQLTLLPTGKFINIHGMEKRLSIIYDNMIPLQFTGLHDKNGYEIYEGDILDFGDINDMPMFVVWDCKKGGWFMSGEDDYFNPLCDINNDHKIIGNIYENQKLLEEIK